MCMTMCAKNVKTACKEQEEINVSQDRQERETGHRSKSVNVRQGRRETEAMRECDTQETECVIERQERRKRETGDRNNV